MRYYNRDFHSNYPAHLDFSHGTTENAVLHKKMMETIANDIVNQALDYYDSTIKDEFKSYIKEVCLEAYKEAIEDFMNVLHYDIESVVEIGLSGCEKIIADRKTQEFISAKIIEEIKKRIDQNHILRF